MFEIWLVVKEKGVGRWGDAWGEGVGWWAVGVLRGSGKRREMLGGMLHPQATLCPHLNLH